jgi:hypothetical protein
VPQDAGTPFLSLLQNFNLSIILIAVLKNMFPTQGYADFLDSKPFQSGQNHILLNTEPLIGLGCLLNEVFQVIHGPLPQDAGTPLLSLMQLINLSVISIAVLMNVPLTQGYRKEPPFLH